MARINDSAVRCWLRRSLFVALVASTTCFAAPGIASASQPIAVRSANPDLEAAASRLASELSSAGYDVRVEAYDPSLACNELNGAWITLASTYENRDTLVATVCFHGSTVVTSGTRDDSARFAVSTAEALNGLQAVPLAVPTARPTSAPPPSVSVSERLPRNPAATAPPRNRRTLSLAETLVLTPNGFPLLWGSSLDAEFPLGAHGALLLGGFFPISRAELANRTAEMRAGLAFVRVGVALRHSFEQLALAGSLVAGPAYTWVDATAVAPYVGGNAGAFSALAGLGLAATYPERGPVFALGLVRASWLAPALHFELPNGSPPSLGPLLLEGSLGVGLRL